MSELKSSIGHIQCIKILAKLFRDKTKVLSSYSLEIKGNICLIQSESLAVKLEF
jgi:hypothetical protein